eukprot:365122-Chlamydomonas_euryale.AAC.27
MRSKDGSTHDSGAGSSDLARVAANVWGAGNAAAAATAAGPAPAPPRSCAAASLATLAPNFALRRCATSLTRARRSESSSGGASARPSPGLLPLSAPCLPSRHLATIGALQKHPGAAAAAAPPARRPTVPSVLPHASEHRRQQTRQQRVQQPRPSFVCSASGPRRNDAAAAAAANAADTVAAAAASMAPLSPPNGDTVPTGINDGAAPDPTDFANYFCTYGYLYHQVRLACCAGCACRASKRNAPPPLGGAPSSPCRPRRQPVTNDVAGYFF